MIKNIKKCLKFKFQVTLIIFQLLVSKKPLQPYEIGDSLPWNKTKFFLNYYHNSLITSHDSRQSKFEDIPN